MNKRLALSFCAYFFSLIALIVLGFSALLWWGVGTTLPKESSLPVEEVKGATPPPPPPFLSVVSYNVGHAHGLKENATDYRDKETTLKQLDLLADAMKKMDADIFLLQEVDLDSNRTFHINQIDFLKQKTGHQYQACALVWSKNYLPFPYWPPAEHIGYIRSANCILSRFPLSNHHRFVFEKPKSNTFWYNWGYIDRAIQRADVTIGDRTIALLNIHLEAWDASTREDQIKIVKDYMDKIELPIILGGDLNTVPPDAIKTSGFPDDPHANYANDKTLWWFYKNEPKLVIPTLHGNINDPFTLFTFPSDAPDRLIDHIFLKGGNMSFIEYRVAKEAGLASDHLPVFASINYKGR